MKKHFILLCCMLMFGMQFIQAQERRITGTVVSADEERPLPGVAVVARGTNRGVITDLEGKYSIEVPDNVTSLEFSFVGMQTEVVEIGNQDVIDVSLEYDNLGIDEVVVTALGIKRETKALGYSTQSVSGDAISGSGETNIIQSLTAKAAGIQVVSSAGTPGASSRILIRGNATFTGQNQPLIVVDGVPIDNRTTTTQGNDYPYNPNLQGVNDSNRGLDIDPNDIESVTILKGPAAAALYGVRAGTGAIIYTTKRGSASGVKATYSYKLDISQVNKLPELQDTYAQGTGGGDWDFTTNTSTQATDADLIEADPGPDMIWFTDDDVSYGSSLSWGPRMDAINREVYDNVSDFFQTAFSHTHNLALNGGSETTNFRLSLGRTDQNGVIPNSSFHRTSVRLTGDHIFGPKFKVGATVNYINSGGVKVQNGSNLAGIMLSLMRCPVNFQLDDPELGYLYPTGSQRTYFALYDNPYFTAYENPFTDDVDRMIGNMSAEFTPFTWLKATYRLGSDFYADQRKQIFATGSNQATDPSGEIYENQKKVKEIYSDLLVTLNHSINDRVNTSLTLGQNLNHRYYEDLFGRGRQLGVPDFYNLSNAAEKYSDETQQTIRTAAIFFDANIDYAGILFLNVTGRNEWASTFGSDKNNFFYPSASASFIFTELLPENNILSFGKIRLAYAQAGINAPVYSSRTYFTQPFITDGFTNGFAYPFNGVNGIGYSNVMGNSSLSPERVTGKELGVDMRFLTGRVNLDFTIYNQLTTEILVQKPLASTTGFRSVNANSGEMSNKGIELSFNVIPVRTQDFEWDVLVNFSKNTSEVLALAEGVNEVQIASAFNDIGSYAIVGQPYGAFYGSKWERTEDGRLIIDDSGLPIQQLETGGIGNPFPDWQTNIRNAFTFKGVTLSAILDIREGGDIWAGTYARLNRQGRTEASADRERTFLIEGVKAEYDSEGALVYETTGDREGQLAYTGEANDVEVSAVSYWSNYKGDFGVAEEIVTDGSWVRLREVALRYKIPLKAKTGFIHSAEISFTGRNLWLRTDYPGVDPETSLTGAGGDPEAGGGDLSGFDYFNNPGSKSYIFGFTVNF